MIGCKKVKDWIKTVTWGGGYYIKALSVLTAAYLTVTLLPGTAFAELGEDTDGNVIVTDITTPEEWADGREVPAGTSKSLLGLPRVLSAEGYRAGGSQSKIATDSNAQKDGEETPLPMTIRVRSWESEPDYDKDAEGESFTFTPVLPDKYELDSHVELPQLTVYVTEKEEIATSSIANKASDRAPLFTIFTQPENQTAAEGEEASFSIEASGEEVTYQWQKGEPPADADFTFDRTAAAADRFVWSDIPGAVDASYAFTASLEDLFDNVYRCRVESNGEALLSRIVWVSEPGNLGRQAQLGGIIRLSMTDDEIAAMFGGSQYVQVERDGEFNGNSYELKITLIQDVELDKMVEFEEGVSVLDVGSHTLSAKTSENGSGTTTVRLAGQNTILTVTGSEGGTVRGGNTASGIADCAGYGICHEGTGESKLILDGKVTIQAGRGGIAEYSYGHAVSILFQGKLLVPEGSDCRLVGVECEDGSWGCGLYIDNSEAPVVIEDGQFAGSAGISCAEALLYSEPKVKISGGVFRGTGDGGKGLLIRSGGRGNRYAVEITGGIFLAGEGGHSISSDDGARAQDLMGGAYVQSLSDSDYERVLTTELDTLNLSQDIVVRSNEFMWDKDTLRFYLPSLRPGMEYQYASTIELGQISQEDGWITIQAEDIQTDSEKGKYVKLSMEKLEAAFGDGTIAVLWRREPERSIEVQGMADPLIVHRSNSMYTAIHRCPSVAVQSVTPSSGGDATDGEVVISALSESGSFCEISRDKSAWETAAAEKSDETWRIAGLKAGTYWLRARCDQPGHLPGKAVSFTVRGPLSTNAKLASLKVTEEGSGVNLIHDFLPEVTDYRVTVENRVARVSIEAAVQDAGKASATGDVGAGLVLAEGENVFQIRVTAEDGETKKTYTATVVRKSGGDSGAGNNSGNENGSGTSSGNGSSSGDLSGGGSAVQNVRVEQQTSQTGDGGTVTTYSAKNGLNGTTVNAQVTRDAAGNVTSGRAEVGFETPETARTDGKATVSVKVDESAVKAAEKAAGVPLGIEVNLPEKALLEQLQDGGAASVEVELTLSSVLTDGSGSRVTKIGVSREILEAAKAAGKDLTVTVKDEKGAALYAWIFMGQDLKNAAQTGDGANLYLQVTPVKKLPEAAKEIKTATARTTGMEENATDGLNVSFAHSGALPATARVRIPSGNEAGIHPGSTVFLYYYNRTEKKLEAVPDGRYTVDASGYVIITLAHSSDYVLLPEKPAGEQPALPAEEAGKTTVYTVKKGDSIYKLAKRHGCSVEEVLALNHVPDIYNLKIGSQLVLPAR